MPDDKTEYTDQPDLVAEVAAWERQYVSTFDFGPDDVYTKEMSDYVISCYETKRADFRFFDFMTPREYSGVELEKHFADILANYSGKFELLDMKIHASGGMAAVSSIQRMTGTDPKGKPYELGLRVTDVLIRKNGTWKFVHQHVSVPVDWATGLADLQSKPKSAPLPRGPHKE